MGRSNSPGVVCINLDGKWEGEVEGWLSLSLGLVFMKTLVFELARYFRILLLFSRW